MLVGSLRLGRLRPRGDDLLLFIAHGTISLGLLVLVAGLMTPLATMRLSRIGAAAGLPPKNGEASEDPEELRRLLADWNPMPIAALGLIAFLVILWLMFAKPF